LLEKQKSMSKLTDKRGLVVGGSSGIGLAVAGAAAREGARIAVTGRKPDRLAVAR
jgi:NAD(P)-dependent dehydrogenase (short-subunit alcohol dehydrogenase family)